MSRMSGESATTFQVCPLHLLLSGSSTHSFVLPMIGTVYSMVVLVIAIGISYFVSLLRKGNTTQLNKAYVWTQPLIWIGIFLTLYYTILDTSRWHLCRRSDPWRVAPAALGRQGRP